MNNNPNNRLDDLLSISEAMRTAAQNGEWEKVAELDIQRRNLLTDLLNKPTDIVTDINQEMNTIFSINKQVLNLAVAARAEAAKQQQTFATSRNNCNAYQQTQNTDLQK